MSKAPVKKPLTVGDMVMTSISHFPGRIVRIEEKRGTSGYSSEVYREASVKLRFQRIDQPEFKEVVAIFLETDLKRHGE